MTAPSPVDAAFTKRLPKLELHAHLSGSISRQCLHEIWEQQREAHNSEDEPALALEDPLLAIPVGKVDYDIDTTVSSVKHSTLSVLDDFHRDGVVYLELRTTPRAMDGLSKEEYVSTVLSCMDEHRRQQQQQQQRLEQQSQAEQQTQEIMASYLILSIDRRNSVEQAMEVVDLAIRFQTLGVVGIDLCGDPTKGDVSIYRETFLKAKTHGLKITLHFAEVPASSTEEELRTLLSYDPDRIGHVIHVSQAIKDEIVKRKLGLELCLSCNVHAKMITGGGGGFADHHFGWWWRRRRDKGCPIALSTDDVGIFCSPLSNEFLLAAEHFDLSRRDLLSLCSGAVESIFAGEDEKSRLRGVVAAFEV
ncbi:hypothetical protein MMC24_006791 [Lignoscripta atroalba]|nr:hypothetical protein [Lignoscripta atroalba]